MMMIMKVRLGGNGKVEPNQQRPCSLTGRRRARSDALLADHFRFQIFQSPLTLHTHFRRQPSRAVEGRVQLRLARSKTQITRA
jgi:hypothetical protein